MRIKDICDFVSRGATPDYVDESPYKVMNQATFSKGWLDESNVRYTSKAIQDAQIQKGDLIMASTGGGVLGKVFYYDSNDNHFYADSHVSILRNSRGANLMKYLYYFFSVRYDEINATLVKGSTNQTELQRNYLLAYELDIPSLQVQQRIVEYLDAKTTEIDNKIELLGKKRDAYNRLKTATINHAVTRGLDERVKLKDSGIEWLGEIPAHWDVKRIKDIGVLKLGKMLDEKPKEGYQCKPYLKSKNVGWLSLNLNDVEEMYFDTGEREMLKLKEGDLVISEGGEVGKTSIWNGELIECYIQNSVHKLTVDKKYDSRYYLYLSFILGQTGYYKSIVNLVSIMHLTFEKLRKVIVLCPPLEEQKQIAAYLDDRCAKIDAAVTIIDKQIDALKRLKRSLINEVVTGKRMV